MKKILFISLALVLALSISLVGCGGTTGTTGSEKIVIGMSRSLTGSLAIVHSSAFGAIYPVYIAKVNTAGGITVNGTAFDVDTKVLNDNSEDAKLIANANTLVSDVGKGKVHTIFGPTSTHFIDVMAPIVNNGECVLMTVEGGATFLEEPGYLPDWSYVFVTLSFSDWYQLPTLAPLLAGAGATSVYIFWQNDAHGQEYLATSAANFPSNGITIVGNQSVLATDPTFNPATLLATANATNPDVVCTFCYPGECAALCGAAIGGGYQFKAWCTGPAANFGWWGGVPAPDGFGGCSDGVMCFATANNETVVPGASMNMSDLYDLIGPLPAQDFWGHPLYWAAMEIWQHAVEAVGATADDGNFMIDQDALRTELAGYISSVTGVTTVLGKAYYTMFGTGGGILAYECHPGEIGQWQTGYVEIIGGNITTGSIVYPKPDWCTTGY